MKILYISSLFNNFVHYQVSSLGETFNLDYQMFFLLNQYTKKRDSHTRKQWHISSISKAIPKDRYSVIEYPGLPKNLMIGLYWLYAYYRVIKNIDQKYDLIHAHSLYPAGYIAMKLSKKLGIPFLVTTHGSDFYEYAGSNVSVFGFSQVEKYINEVLMNADRIIAVSQKFSTDILKFCHSAKVSVVENTYNQAIFRFENQKKKDYKMIHFISIGNFVKLKNHICLLKAFLKCYQKNNQLRLTIIGGGPLLETYQDFIEQHHLNECVRIIGFTNQERLVDYYLEADIFVLPSVSEAFGIVLLEAFACGLPAISTKTQGPLTLIKDGENGFLTEIDSENDLADKMEYMSSQPDLLRYMQTNALKKAEEYKRKIFDIYDLYEKVTK